MAPMKVEIEFPRDLLTALDISAPEVGRTAKEWMVLELFHEGEVEIAPPRSVNRAWLPYLDAE